MDQQANQINFEIVTPERVVLKTQASSISVPTKQGEITILPHHIPLVASLQPGVLVIKHNGQIEEMAVSGGFIEVLPTKVVVLADTAERATEIDEERATKAIERAKQLMTEKRHDAEGYAAAVALLEKELARTRAVARRKYRQHS